MVPATIEAPRVAVTGVVFPVTWVRVLAANVQVDASSSQPAAVQVISSVPRVAFTFNLGKFCWLPPINPLSIPPAKVIPLKINTIKYDHAANKVISAVVTGKEDKDAGGLTTDFVDVPDWSNRLKASELSMKLKGRLREKVDVEHGGAVEITFKVVK